MAQSTEECLGKCSNRSSKALAEWLYNYHLDHLSYFSAYPVLQNVKIKERRPQDNSPRVLLRPTVQIYKYPNVSTEERQSNIPPSPGKVKNEAVALNKEPYKIFKHKFSAEETLDLYRKTNIYPKQRQDKIDKKKIEAAVSMYRPKQPEKKPVTIQTLDPANTSGDHVKKKHKKVYHTKSESEAAKLKKVSNSSFKKSGLEEDKVTNPDVKRKPSKTHLKREKGNVDLSKEKRKHSKYFVKEHKSKETELIKKCPTKTKTKKDPVPPLKEELSVPVVDVALDETETHNEYSQKFNEVKTLHLNLSPGGNIKTPQAKENVCNEKVQLNKIQEPTVKQRPDMSLKLLKKELNNVKTGAINEDLIHMLLPKYVKNSVRGESNGKEYYFNFVPEEYKTKSSEMTLSKFNTSNRESDKKTIRSSRLLSPNSLFKEIKLFKNENKMNSFNENTKKLSDNRHESSSKSIEEQLQPTDNEEETQNKHIKHDSNVDIEALLHNYKMKYRNMTRLKL